MVAIVRNMLTWAAVLLVGILILIVHPMLRGEVPPDQAGGFGASLMVPFGYFLSLIGAGGIFVAWLIGRAR